MAGSVQAARINTSIITISMMRLISFTLKVISIVTLTNVYANNPW
jgi:hypothetical protein